ncbi:dihydroorotase [Saccharopolyspora dendranthemae]|uniref:Allantoinase n=1 Tax=Saccharopolyspora dendranthemae TaxID=1181886 RepID=A0A561U2P4_9PSEU|nr:dihydroorotase family protein [Saccharopolyspora dendranthemae]TWF93639.1 allantoinase [Saccharopolyspora dendranthemae]
MTRPDLIIRDVRVVRPGGGEPVAADIAVTGGVVSEVGPGLAVPEGTEVHEGRGQLAFPGVVDAHQHWGIYNPLSDDTATESRACAQGGVTTSLTYMRTGQYYLNRGGPYSEVFPEVLAAAEGKSYVDYAFHLAPMQSSHIDEIPSLVRDHGVTSFKIFMFYGSHGLHGRSTDQSDFLMIPEGERYDIAHFEFVMRGIQAAREANPDIADQISLSLHCETAEIMTAYTRLVEEEGSLSGLEAYSASRPPHSEGLAVTIASYLAHETGLPTINLLHLSSAKAMEAAMLMAKTFPHVDFRREVTIGHLLADVTTADGIGGKVNPPLRPRADVEKLWDHLLAGDVSWVVSDHACCREEKKFGQQPDDVFSAKSGFGGTEYLLPGLVGEGRKRGLPMSTVAELVSTNPARRLGLPTKGDIAPGFDADIALVDPDRSFVVDPADSESTQEYTPFRGMEIGSTVETTFLRGQRIFDEGQVRGEPRGTYLHRPTGR